MEPHYYLSCLLGIFASLWASAQCAVTMNYNGLGCGTTSSGTSGNFISGSTNCDGATTILWSWTFSNGATGQHQSNAPQFQFPVTAPLGVNQVCFEAQVMNGNNDVLTISEQCFPINPNALGVNVTVTQNATGCGLHDGCAYFEIVGGTPPYSWWLGGLNQSPQSTLTTSQLCNFAPGLHYLVVSDSGGCTITHTFTIPTNPPQGIAARVFNDLNSDGLPGSGVFAEPVLGGMAFYIVEADITVYSGTNGYFYLPNLPDGSYTIQFVGDTDIWFLANPLVIQAPDCIQIPLETTATIYAQNSGLTGFGSVLHCQNGLNTGVWVANTGNTPFSGTIVLTGPSNLTYTALNTGQTFASQSGGIVTWNVNGQAPGVQTNYTVHVNGPGTSFVGQSFPMTLTITLNDGDGNPIYTNSWTINPVVTCAYDPNDKLALPEGYADPHFVLADTEITYTIRFQNTGNAPAEDVWIDDPLDIAHLDMNSFEPVAASHDYYSVLEPNGSLRFYFDNIMLPDSVNNEPESHGYVMFRMRLKDDVQTGDVIHNQAGIYFDLNEPIITNETWHTVYSCDALITSTEELEFCQNEPMVVTDSTPYVESYSWSWNGTAVSDTETLMSYASPEGQNTLILTLANPLCEVSTSRQVTVHPLPEVTLSMENENLVASTDGVSTWYLNGELIDGITGNVLADPISGYYTVEVTDENGCTASASTTVVGVGALTAERVALYPNPIVGESRLVLPDGIWTISISDAIGRELSRMERLQGVQTLNAGNFSPGHYIVRGRENGGTTWAIPVLIY